MAALSHQLDIYGRMDSLGQNAGRVVGYQAQPETGPPQDREPRPHHAGALRQRIAGKRAELASWVLRENRDKANDELNALLDEWTQAKQ